MELPDILDKQLDTLLHLYKFHYLNTNQVQKLFHHKNPQRVQVWLKDDINTIDFKTGAELILDSIRKGSYKDMLKHNLAQSKKFNPTYVGSEYIKLFNQIQD